MSELGTGTNRDGLNLHGDLAFAQFINLKSIEYIHSQFYARRNNRDDVVDTKNACFQDLYSVVDEVVKKSY